MIEYNKWTKNITAAELFEREMLRVVVWQQQPEMNDEYNNIWNL